MSVSTARTSRRINVVLDISERRYGQRSASLADLNTRTGSLQSSSRGVEWLECWKRVSADSNEKINTRGRALVQECDLYDLCILNGTHLETSSPGPLTSWHPIGESVVDYAIVSTSLLPMVPKFHVELPAEDEDDDWADHVRICITLDSKAFEYASLPAREGGKFPTSRAQNILTSFIKRQWMQRKPKMKRLLGTRPLL